MFERLIKYRYYLDVYRAAGLALLSALLVGVVGFIVFIRPVWKQTFVVQLQHQQAMSELQRIRQQLDDAVVRHNTSQFDLAVGLPSVLRQLQSTILLSEAGSVNDTLPQKKIRIEGVVAWPNWHRFLKALLSFSKPVVIQSMSFKADAAGLRVKFVLGALGENEVYSFQPGLDFPVLKFCHAAMAKAGEVASFSLLQLTLRGVLVSSGQAVAYLGAPNGVMLLVKKGDTVGLERAKVVQIAKNGVHLATIAGRWYHLTG